MKYQRMAIFVETTEGEFYQVALGEQETDMVQDLIMQIHEGKIKVIPRKFDGLHFMKKYKKDLTVL